MVRDMACLAPPVAEEDGGRIVGVPGQDEDRSLDRAAAVAQLHHVVCLQVEAFGRGRAEQHRVIPGQLGQRLGQLLQPGVIGKSPIPDAGVRPEDDLQAPALAPLVVPPALTWLTRRRSARC